MISRRASFSGTIADAPARPDRPAAPADTTRDPRPKVLHFIPGIGGGGAEAMLHNLAESLRDSAWRTVVVAVDGRSHTAEASRLRRSTGAYYDLESDALLNGALLRRFRRILRVEKPDLVQTWMHHADLVGGLWARWHGVKHIVWGIHCREIHRNPTDGEGRMRAFRAALAAASRFLPRRIVSCSATAIDDHVRLGYPRRKMQWIPNGVCPRKFTPRPDEAAALRSGLGLPDGAPIIGFAGRFHEMKRLDIFLRSAALLQRGRPNAHFVLCGGTHRELDEAAREAWKQVPRPDQVHFIPFREDMEEFYPALSLFSLSSRTEACPMTLLEAMACGVPCAATDAGDCAALLGGSDFIAPTGDPAALASVWEKILSLDAPTLGARMRSRVIGNFTIARAAALYQSLYAGLLASPA